MLSKLDLHPRAILDVGAFLGQFSANAIKTEGWQNAEVVMVEATPTPDLEGVCRNMTKCTLFKNAVSDRNETVQFYSADSKGGGSTGNSICSRKPLGCSQRPNLFQSKRGRLTT